MQHVECQGRRNQTAGFRVACALLGLELVSAVRCTDRDSQRVAACAGSEVDDLFGLGVVRLLSCHLVLNTGEHTELALYGDVVLVSILNNLARDADVLLVGQRAAVVHHAGEAHVDAVLAELEAVTVVEVQHDFGMSATEFLCISNSTLSHVAKDGSVSIVACAFRHLHDDGRLGFYCSLNDGLHLLHCVEVECGNSIAASNGSLEHFSCVNET